MTPREGQVWQWGEAEPELVLKTYRAGETAYKIGVVHHNLLGLHSGKVWSRVEPDLCPWNDDFDDEDEFRRRLL